MDSMENFPVDEVTALIPKFSDLVDKYGDNPASRYYLLEDAAKLLVPIKDKLEACEYEGGHYTVSGFAESMVDAIISEKAALKVAFPRHSKPQLPMRVDVHNGDQSVHLGHGTYVADVSVYFVILPDGSLSSLSNAEEEPAADTIPPGAVVRESPSNPKIVLDNGQVVYGCQVWWSPLKA